MKPWIYSFLVAFLLLLVACGETNQDQNKPPLTTDSNVFIGQIEGTDALIALVIEGQEFLAYSCGGEDSWQELTAWFEGELLNGSVVQSKGDWGSVLSASRSGTEWTGTLEVFGKTHIFRASAARAQSPAGLYILDTDTREAGLIVDNNLNTAGVYYGKASGVTATIEVESDLGAISSSPSQLRVRSSAYGGSNYTLSSVRKPTSTPSAITPALPVPIDLHRRAAEVLEEARETEMAPNWGRSAKLTGEFTPFYRPDLKDAAYLEFAVEPEGAITVSTGRHDFPVPDWRDMNITTAAELMKIASVSGVAIERFYKLDSLAYAAEDAKGNRVAKTDNPFFGFACKTCDWLNEEPREISSSVRPTREDGDDDDAEETEWVVDPQDYADDLEIIVWDSWLELKDDYADAHKLRLESLRRNAAEDWDIDDLVAASGEGLVVGIHKVALLYSDVRFQVSPDISKFASVTLQDRKGLNLAPLLLIDITALPPTNEALPFSISVAYRNGVKEELKYAIVNASSLPGEVQVQQTSWSSWITHSAGNASAQRYYGQFGIDYNGTETSLCAVGCVPVAFAMLFGWADNQAASSSSQWAPRWGLYRQNGGFGSNAVAPDSNNAGIQNVIEELNGHMGTFCTDGQGGTYRWDYVKAGSYLQGRTKTKLEVHWWFEPTTGIRDHIRDSVTLRFTPAVAGFDSHAFVVWRYRWRSRIVTKTNWFGGSYQTTEYGRQFYVNNGWPGSTNNERWQSAQAHVTGLIFP